MSSTSGQGYFQNNSRVVQNGPTRILCVADVRGKADYLSFSGAVTNFDLVPGNLKSLNDLAQQAKANYIIHTGDFGFYDEDSLKRIADK